MNQGTLSQQARSMRLAQQVASLPQDVREAIQANYADGQVVVLPLPYWSTVRFQSVRAAGPPVTFTIDTTTRQAFSYGVGQSPVGAGFLAAYGNALASETNLIRANETRDNADVWIWGIAAYLTPESEPALARRVFRDTSVSISLNGTQSIPLGTLEMFPAGGGLYGQGTSFIKSPDLATPGGTDNGTGVPMGFVNNGNPMSGSFFRLNQPFKWAGVGSAGSDSSLSISCTPQRSIVETSALARVAAAGISAFTPPAAAGDLGTFVDVRFRLVSVSVQRRSVNA